MTKPMPTDEELFAATSSGITPGKPFGWDHMRALDRIRAEITAEDPKRHSVSVAFEVSRRFSAEQATKLTFSQRQDLARWLGLPWAGRAMFPGLRLTDDELAYVLERLSGTNDLMGVSAREKLESMLGIKK